MANLTFIFRTWPGNWHMIDTHYLSTDLDQEGHSRIQVGGKEE